MFDLNKHLQFVNSTNGLMGKQISKKTHHLPPMTLKPEKKPQKLECSELFAITTVQQSNDPNDVSTPSTQNIFQSVETSDMTDSGLGQSQLSSREINTTSWKDTTDDEGHANFSWRNQKTFKPEVLKFGKLPKISSSNTNNNSNKDEYSSPEHLDTKSITKRLNDSLQRCASWVSESDSVNGEYAELREMKVTINIKYKPDGNKGKKPMHTKLSKSVEDMSVNLTPFDRAKHLKHMDDDEKCHALLSE